MAATCGRLPPATIGLLPAGKGLPTQTFELAAERFSSHANPANERGRRTRTTSPAPRRARESSTQPTPPDRGRGPRYWLSRQGSVEDPGSAGGVQGPRKRPQKGSRRSAGRMPKESGSRPTRAVSTCSTSTMAHWPGGGTDGAPGQTSGNTPVRATSETRADGKPVGPLPASCVA